MSQVYRVPLVLTPQHEGGFTVTSPILPGLVTEGDSLERALEHVEDALRATLELYEDTGRPVPPGLLQDPDAGAIQFDLLLPALWRVGVTYREVTRKLRWLGCEDLPRRSGGSHRKWHNSTTGGAAVLPDWGGRDLKLGTVRAAVRELGIDWEQFAQA